MSIHPDLTKVDQEQREKYIRGVLQMCLDTIEGTRKRGWDRKFVIDEIRNCMGKLPQEELNLPKGFCPWCCRGQWNDNDQAPR